MFCSLEHFLSRNSFHFAATTSKQTNNNTESGGRSGMRCGKNRHTGSGVFGLDWSSALCLAWPGMPNQLDLQAGVGSLKHVSHRRICLRPEHPACGKVWAAGNRTIGNALQSVHEQAEDNEQGDMGCRTPWSSLCCASPTHENSHHLQIL